jgi:hypothetical protein
LTKVVDVIDTLTTTQGSVCDVVAEEGGAE